MGVSIDVILMAGGERGCSRMILGPLLGSLSFDIVVSAVVVVDH